MRQPRFISILLALCLLAPRVLAQAPDVRPAEAPPASRDAAENPATPVAPPIALDHGWVGVRDNRVQKTHFLHIPPRLLAPRPERSEEPGALRMTTGTDSLVAAVTSWTVAGGSSAAFVMHDEAIANPPGADAGLPPKRIRRVVGMTAVEGGPGFAWGSLSETPEILPPLPGGPALAGFASDGRGPVALLADRRAGEASESEAGESWSLLKLIQNRWVPVDLPWTQSVAASQSPWPSDHDHTIFLVSWTGGVGVLVVPRGETEGELWLGALEAELPRQPSPPQNPGASSLPEVRLSAAWSRHPVSLPAETAFDGVVRVGAPGGAWAEGGYLDRMVAWSFEGPGSQRVRLFELRERTVRDLGWLDGVSREARVTSVGREGGMSGLAFVWITETELAPPQPANNDARQLERRSQKLAQIMLREVALTGDELFSAPAQTGAIRFRRELQVLAIVMLMLMVAVVLFVVRGDQAAVVNLPAGVQVAAPLRRFAGFVFDFLPAAMAAEWFTGGSLQASGVLFGAQGDARTILLAFGIAWVHTTLCEYLIGRSLGKIITGTWVMPVSAAPGDESARGAGDGGSGGEPVLTARAEDRLTLRACIIRNLVRWLAPVLGGFVLIDSNRRHPGDVAAGTIVVQPGPAGVEPTES